MVGTKYEPSHLLTLLCSNNSKVLLSITFRIKALPDFLSPSSKMLGNPLLELKLSSCKADSRDLGHLTPAVLCNKAIRLHLNG